MSGPVDVLAYLDARIATHKALSADAYHAQEVPKAEAVRAAVAELIEAVIENRDATQAFANDGAPSNYVRFDDSERRVLAALARVGGAS